MNCELRNKTHQPATTGIYPGHGPSKGVMGSQFLKQPPTAQVNGSNDGFGVRLSLAVGNPMSSVWCTALQKPRN